MGVPVPQLMEAVVEVIPQERVQNRTLEQIEDFPVLRTMEAPVDVVLSTPQERVLNRTQEQIVGVPVPPITEAAVEVVREKPLERVQNRTQQPIVNSPVPQFMEAAVENCVVEQIAVTPVPQFMEEQLVDVQVPQIMEAAVENRFPEQIVNSPVPQFMEVAVENCVGEQIVDVPVPQLMETIVKFYCLRHSYACSIARWSRSWIPCLGSWRQLRELCVLHHRSACRIVLGSSSLMFQCPTSWSKLPGRSSALEKVFTVLHHRDDQACSDNVGFIKGLDQHNMPRLLET